MKSLVISRGGAKKSRDFGKIMRNQRASFKTYVYITTVLL